MANDVLFPMLDSNAKDMYEVYYSETEAGPCVRLEDVQSRLVEFAGKLAADLKENV